MVSTVDLSFWFMLMIAGQISVAQRDVTFATQKTYPTDLQPQSVVAADVNGDNQTDIIVASFGSNYVSILLNAGNGTFSPRKTYGTGSQPMSVAAADLNGDNKPDIIIANSGQNTIGVLLNKGNGTFANQTAYTTANYPRFVVATDVNGDNHTDIIASHTTANYVAVLLNNGNGTFTVKYTYPAGPYPLSLAAVDLNGDNKPDIIVTNTQSNNVGVFLNRGNGSFTNQTTYATDSYPRSVAVADINGDNKSDIIVANANASNVGVLLNIGNGTFTSQTTYSSGYNPYSVAVVDINDDNKADIIVANYNSSNVGILLNAGTGIFTAQMTYSTGSGPQSVAVADVNGDKQPDIIVANPDSNNVGVLLSLGYTDETTTPFIQTTTIQQQSSIMTSTEVMTTSKPITNRTCFSPVITLIPGRSSLSSPTQFRRNEDFYISSNIDLKCNSSLSTNIKWTIHNCLSSCSYEIQLNPTIKTTTNEIYIPAQTLSYGVYQLNLTVSMVVSSSLTTTASAYVQITSAGVIANLVQLGTSMITSGYEQDLLLNPGTYSVDLDGYAFNVSNWKYNYYCRIYGLYNFPTFDGSLLTIENSTIDPYNPSCLSNRTDNETSWKYNDISLKSSLIILAGSLQPNRTYQFMVNMENRANNSLQTTGYVLVQVENTFREMIAIGCVISTMCVSNMEFQLVNPTTQVALFALCLGNCTTIENIIWNVYKGWRNSSSNVTEWILFDQMNQYENIWFFGRDTSNFTATNQLFLTNSQIDLWRFEVVYSFPTEISSSALSFMINQPPINGSCTIDPLNGTTSTLFTISCLNWFDEDGLKDYSLYIWTSDPSKRTMLAFSAISTFAVRLPAVDEPLHLVVSIRDTSDCITEMNMSSVTVIQDSAGISDLINCLQSSSNGITNNPIVQILAGGNQNTVGQVLISVAQQFNQMNSQSVENAVSNGVAATSISISPLGSVRTSGTSVPLNQSALIELNKELNTQANVRDYLMSYTTNLPIITSNSIKLQATSLAQMTQSTNELTRTALTLAAEKCYQLSLALYAMATRIPYEDVQIGTTQLIQCGVNVLSAVNGPLQQRTNVLNLDSSRATTFPDNYDTDLESEWSNLNLFADGNDFSYETIQIGRNRYYQQQLATQLISQITAMISSLTSALNIHLNIGQNFTMNTPSTLMSLETLSIQSLSNKQIPLPVFNPNNTQRVSLRSIMQPLALYGNSSKSPVNTNLSRSISLSVLDQNGNELPVQVNLSHPIEILIPRDPNLILSPIILQNVTSIPHNQLFNLYYINIISSQTISIHFEIYPLNLSLSYLFIYKFDETPRLNSSINQIDGWTLFCPVNFTNESIYTYFLNNQQTKGHQSVIFGLRELNSTEMNNFCSNNSISNPPITNEAFNFTSDYQLRIYTSGCYYLDSNNQWQSDGLVVGPLTNHEITQCFSTHLTTFAGSLTFLPAPINWNYVFTNADFLRNKTVYLTVIFVCVMFILLLIYARLNDKKDLEKLSVTPLPDNYSSDHYYYEILVFTGRRKDAGTKSKVHFILAGNNGKTPVRTLTNPDRVIFQRGGIDAFLIAVPKSLGSLKYIQIWHDNSGKGSSSSWFLKYLIIRDLKTMQKFHFICQRWFAVEKDDGKIERLLTVATEIEKQEFSYVLSKQAYHSISDGHLWFSIFARPVSNRFTRVQRCTCCFVLFFISMFLNIMYYDLSNATKTTNSLSFGPIHISSEEILVGILADIFVLILSLLLVQFFRRIRTRERFISPLSQAFVKIKSQVKMKMQKKRSGIRFPWWCLFLAYGLCLIFVGISIFFIIVRGIEFGDLKTQKWLTSILLGFFSSIFLTQPLKILSLSIFFACFCRNINVDKEANGYFDDHQIYFDIDEDYSQRNSPFTYRRPNRANRLTDGRLVYARQQRLKEIQMWSILREVFTYLCFFSLLCTITYANQNSNAYFQVDHLQKYFLNSDLIKISSINEYWNWLEGSFVSNIRAQEWYNGDSPRNLNGFIDDKTNRLIGWSTMRQLRIKSDFCSYSKVRLNCLNDYNLLNEEMNSFKPGWMTETTKEYSSSILRAFQYQSSRLLDSYVSVGNHGSYSGNGYVYEFRGRLSDLQSNLSQLHQLEWIDNHTRAVIIQLNLYNPNVELFTATTFLTEFSSTGRIDSTARFEPMSFYVFSSKVQLLCMIFYVIFILYFMSIEMRSVFQLKSNYFRQFWSYIELGIIICTWISVRIYIWRYHEYHRISSLFEETNGYVYINLQLAAYLNNILTCLFGFCCFFGTIKFLYFCQFNQRLSLFSQTLCNAAKELFSFTVMFSIILFAFVCLFYFLFIAKLWTCSNLLHTTQMLFEMTLLKFDATELIDAAAFLGPFCFSLFILFVVFICLSMFVSIINDNFRRAREKMTNDNWGIFSFMFDRFQRWTGWKKPTEEEIYAERDALMREEYFDPIKLFSVRTDQLLDVINRRYSSQQSRI